MEQTPTKNCELCKKSKGVLFCYECKKALCQPCREAHDNIPLVSHHKITDIQHVDRTAMTSRSECSPHQRDFSFFCSTCKVLACSQCVTTTHRNHSFLDIAEVAAEARNFASNYIADMKEKQKKLSTLISKVKSDIKDLKKEAAETMVDIDCVVREIVGIIDAQKGIKYTDVQDAEVLQCQDLDVYLKNAEKIDKTYQRVCREFENLMSEKHDLTFYHCFNTSKRDFLELDSVPIESEYQHIPKFDGQTFAKVVTCFIGKQFDIGLCENCDKTKARIKELEDQEQQLQIRYQTDMKRAEETKDSLSRENAAVQGKLNDKEKRYWVTNQERERLSKENDAIKRNLQDAEQRYYTDMKRAEEEKESLSRENVAVQGKLNAMEKRYQATVKEKERLSRENNVIKWNLMEANKRYHTDIGSLSDVQRKLNEAEKRYQAERKKDDIEWNRKKSEESYRFSRCEADMILAKAQALSLSTENATIKVKLKDTEKKLEEERQKTH